MALVFENPGVGPRTHVLLIGVGGYRHLLGGPDPMRDPYLYGGLGQLSSPPLSALAFRDRLLATDADEWRAPLGSIDLLISPHPGEPLAAPVTQLVEPTRANITTRFDEWVERCDSDSGNVAILYFCGHGVQNDEQYLLASDFGEAENRRWENAIAIDGTINGLSHCRAETQCVFIDACREPSTEASGSPLAEFSDNIPARLKYPLVLRAVDRGRQAFGRQRSVSYFTQALLASLLGAAAEEEDGSGEWVVTTGSMASKFEKVLALTAPGLTPPRPEPGLSVALYRPPEPPQVHVTVGCRPDEALPLAQLSYRHESKNCGDERAPEASPWGFDVEAGYYHVTATFSGAEYTQRTELLLADPPHRSRNLRVH